MYNVLVANNHIPVTDTLTHGPLCFDLCHYCEATVRGTMRMDVSGTLCVDLVPAVTV